MKANSYQTLLGYVQQMPFCTKEMKARWDKLYLTKRIADVHTIPKELSSRW